MEIFFRLLAFALCLLRIEGASTVRPPDDGKVSRKLYQLLHAHDYASLRVANSLLSQYEFEHAEAFYFFHAPTLASSLEVQEEPLPALLEFMAKLRDVCLTDASDGNLTPVLTLFPAVESLDLSFSGEVTTLSQKSFAKVPHLKRLILFDTGLARIAEGTFRPFTQLTELDLSRTKLTSFPMEAIANLTKLEKLNLRGIPGPPSLLEDVFARHPRLRELELSNTGICVFGEKAFASLSKLEELDISGTGITSLSKKNFNPPLSLTRLVVSDTGLTRLRKKDFKNLPNLKRFSACRTRLANIDKNCFEHAPDLCSLYLSENPLLTVLLKEAFQGLSKLQRLSLSGSNLVSVGGGVLRPLENLEELYLSDMPLRNLRTKDFKTLRNLKKLDIRGNKALCGLDKNLLKHAPCLEGLLMEDIPLSPKVPLKAFLETLPRTIKHLHLGSSSWRTRNFQVEIRSMGLTPEKFFRTYGALQTVWINGRAYVRNKVLCHPVHRQRRKGGRA